MVGKILAGTLSFLGVIMGGVSFIFNAAKSTFDLCGRIGIGGILMVTAIVILFHNIRKSTRQESGRCICGEELPEVVMGDYSGFCHKCAKDIGKDVIIGV
ncbi:hypothetical protein HZB05_00670 [Candidatus Wolfebacteria bacterium]|nr:hypothetical protein [Candidatus Wolfebacteria bacterium]